MAGLSEWSNKNFTIKVFFTKYQFQTRIFLADENRHTIFNPRSYPSSLQAARSDKLVRTRHAENKILSLSTIALAAESS